MNSDKPLVVIVAGPNGAGKSTLAPDLLAGALKVVDYVNADTIAQGLSAFAPEQQAFRAGRIMLGQLKKFAAERRSFAFESTLATKSYAPWLGRLTSDGYFVRVVFLSLPSPEVAIARVEARVRAGGHAVPAEVVRRRFKRGLANFLSMYSPLAAEWSAFDNSGPVGPELLASGSAANTQRVLNESKWNHLLELARGES